MPDEITVYSDYVCPFCYLGRESLRRYQATREEPLAIDWHPFDLRSNERRPDGSIDHSVDDGKDESYFEQARENVRRLQERYETGVPTFASDGYAARGAVPPEQIERLVEGA